MVISPVILIVCAAILLSACIFCLVNRPRKPIFTGVLIVLLLSFAFMTLAVNMQLSSPGASNFASPTFIAAVVSFITLSPMPTQQQLNDAFSLLAKIDIGLILAIIISMFFEVKSLLKQNKPSKQFRGKK